jgi:ferric-chelate reductase (NADPH)
MASFGKAIGDSLKKLLFRELTVARVAQLSEHFERVDFVGEALRGVRYAPGSKLQITFEGGPRTYTPFHFDGARGSLSILIHLHGDGPSARWAKQVKEGERAFTFGPRSSLELSSATSPIALFGDETSFGLARALREAGGTSGLGFVFEVTHPVESRTVLDGLELHDAELVERRGDDAQLSEVEARLRARLAHDGGTRLVLTGKAPSIQAIRKRLKAEPAVHASQLVKAYWSPGKRGLD